MYELFRPGVRSEARSRHAGGVSLESLGEAGEPSLDSFAAITDEPTPEVAATGHQRTIITIQEQYLSEWLSPRGLSKERLEHILSDKELPYYVYQIAA